MARLKSEDAGISLFPFMSILVCLIGGLTLMIAGLTVGQMNQEQSQEEIDRYRRYKEIEAELQKHAQDLQDLRKLIAQAEKLREQSKLAVAEVAVLEKKQKDAVEQAGAQEHRELLAEANRLRKRIAELQPEPAQLQAVIDDLKKQIEKANAGPEEAVVQIRSGGSGVDIAPAFVECTGTGVVVHEGPEPLRIRTGDLNKPDGDFHKLLDRVAGTENGQVIFLVRPDAVGTYNAARQVARTHYGPNGYCKNGKLPVPTQGQLDLSQFRR